MILEAWEHLNEYIRACPHHGIDEWLIIQGFYHALTGMARSHLDASAGGAFLQKNVKDAKDLIEKMVINQGWNEERLQPKKRGVHALNEVDMLSAKMDLLMKKIEESSSKKGIEAIQTPPLFVLWKLIHGARYAEEMITRAITAPRPRR